LKPLQRGLSLQVLGQRLARLAAVVQFVGLLDKIIDADVLIIRPLGSRAQNGHEQG